MKYLGLLGLIGLLGVFPANPDYYGFFGFFRFFAFSNVVNNERLDLNINKATRNAFIASLIVFVIANIWANFTLKADIFIYTFVANFVLLILVFCFSFIYYDRANKFGQIKDKNERVSS
ncbi:DUF3796 domain-containing protein [Natroniella sp. ANB-PHB2]|uniref:DUF3796 domain-containing protein n=1 Tax=Natroniella sp. ANB-PHB2 TaxID=3384444 RepID=UPI0038D4273B